MIWLLANWKLVAMGALAMACAVMFGLWKNEEAGRASDRLAAAKAVLEAQQKANALSDELIIAQAAAMAVTIKKEAVYVDQIRLAPNDRERLRLGIVGMRDLVRGGDGHALGGAAPAVPGPGPSGRP